MKKYKYICAIFIAISSLIYYNGVAVASGSSGDENIDLKKEENNIQDSTIKRNSTYTKPEAIRFTHVSKLTVHGAESITKGNKQLESILSRYQNKMLSMDDFNKALQEINDHFRHIGYPAATCYLPEQESSNGEFFINVEFGKIGKVILENDSNLNESLLHGLLSNIKSGELVRSRDLETSIYNINEIGGVQAAGFFRPGEKIGMTDVIVRVINKKQDNYVITTDNFGSESSGRYHYTFIGEWINKFNNGERIVLNGSTSNQRQRNYGISYEQIIAKNGTKASISVGNSDYELGSIYSSMGVTGRADNYVVAFSTPLWKTSTSRLILNYGFVYRNLNDEMRYVDYIVNKHTSSGYLGLGGSEWIGKTFVNYDFTANVGRMICDEAHIMGYPLKIASEGGYVKGTAEITTKYIFNNKFDLLISGQAQKASTLLDSSEQFFLGGAKGIRAYPQGEGSGDEGYLINAELAYRTGIKGLSLSTFYDQGYVRYTKDNSVLGGIFLRGWGLGLTYSSNNYWIRADYARRIGMDRHASKAAEAKGRIWLTAGVYF